MGTVFIQTTTLGTRGQECEEKRTLGFVRGRGERSRLSPYRLKLGLYSLLEQKRGVLHTKSPDGRLFQLSHCSAPPVTLGTRESNIPPDSCCGFEDLFLFRKFRDF